MQSAIFQESAVALQFDEYPHSKLMDSVFYQIDKGISVYFWQHCCYIMLSFLAWCIWTLLIGETYPVLLLSTVVNLPTVPLSVFPTMGPHPKNDVPNTLTRREQHWRMKRRKTGFGHLTNRRYVILSAETDLFVRVFCSNFAAWNSRRTTWILVGFTIFDLWSETSDTLNFGKDLEFRKKLEFLPLESFKNAQKKPAFQCF